MRLTRLPIVPLADEQPRLLAEERRRARLEGVDRGSSANTSSPTSAAAIAARIASVGWVTVSERRSIRAMAGGA